MSPRRRDEETPATGSTLADAPDAEDPRTFEHGDAQAVRTGNLSAAQLADGHGNVDPNNPDAQYPPGVVQNTSAAGDVTAEPSAFLPERSAETGFVTTAATPDYGTNAEE